jgi:hypothetical protein
MNKYCDFFYENLLKFWNFGYLLYFFIYKYNLIIYLYIIL